MSIQYKIDVLKALKDKGYSTKRIRTEKIMGEAMLQKIRTGELPSWGVFDKLCALLECQPSDIIEYIPDIEENADQ